LLSELSPQKSAKAAKIVAAVCGRRKRRSLNGASVKLFVSIVPFCGYLFSA
jgi:hypothetical protein